MFSKLPVVRSQSRYYRDYVAKYDDEQHPVSSFYKRAADLEYVDSCLIDTIRHINSNFVLVGDYLRKIEDESLFDSPFGGFAKDVYAYASHRYGLKKTSTYLLIAIARQFAENGVLNDKWNGYMYSQLCEILPMSEELRAKVRPDMTIKQLRELKATANTLTAGNVQTSEQSFEAEIVSSSADVKSLEVVSDVDVPVHTTLLNLKNRKAREQWLENYHNWGVWLTVPQLELTLYKFVFANGHELVVSESYAFYSGYTTEKVLMTRYHLKSDKCTFFDMAGIAKTYVLDYLTEFARQI